MENLLLGIPTILLCSTGFYFAWRAAKAGNFQVAIFLIVAGGLFLRIYAGTDFFLHEWDERYHALVAKNLMEQPFKPTLYRHPVLPYDYTDWSSNYIWLHKQPAPLWAMALSLGIFGVNEIALRLPSILLSSLAIWLTYRIACHFVGRRMALLAAFLQAIHGLIIELTSGRVATDHIDLFFLFFIELGIYFSIRFIKTPKWYFSILIGISTGLGILTKWMPALIVILIWGLLAVHKKLPWPQIFVHAFIIFGATALTFLPWQIYIVHTFPQEAHREYAYNVMHLFEDLGDHGEPWYYYLNRMRIIYGELIYLPLIWFIYIKGQRLFKNRPVGLSLLTWIWIPVFFFSFAVTKMQAYTIFSAPAFFILTALFFRYFNIWKEKFFFPKYISNLILALLVLLPARYSIERVKPFTIRERRPEWAENFKALEKQFPLDSTTVVFNMPKPIEFMFYTNAIAYPFLPETKTLDSLSHSGYKLLKYESKTLKKIGN
ncbi:MAG: glycosyltransferase family 39 protein [Lewinellaceae bacterium]|nr:glycosyltransferase family 39 protein [Lewinellaceae bacterium]